MLSLLLTLNLQDFDWQQHNGNLQADFEFVSIRSSANQELTGSCLEAGDSLRSMTKQLHIAHLNS